MSNLDHTFAVILAGGGGTRLWPKSRNQTPKQFLKLMGPDTMMQMSVNRINKLVPWERIIVVTNKLYKQEIKDQLPALPAENVIAEPQKRDTALAMLVGAQFALGIDREAVIINCASDHVVTNETEFFNVMKAANQVAAENEYLVSVGITPNRPATGFGYIKIGQDLKKINHGQNVFQVENFTEKPNRATAQAFISTGRYFWNANMYVWSAKALLVAFEQHQPKLFAQTNHLSKLSHQDFHAALPDIYDQAETISIDYAISEKVNNLVLIPGDFGWDDVGDWKVVYDLDAKNLEGNVIIGDNETHPTLTIRSHNNLIHTDKRLIALYGVNDLVIIDTPDILMIVPKNESQDVKKIVERLKEEDKKEYL